MLGADGFIAKDDVRFAAAGLAAAVVLVVLNHLILSVMLRLARGHSLKESGLFSFESLSTDLVLAALGVLVAYAWLINPALIPFAVAPLLLIHRSLAVPFLEHEARLDPKTGLFNVRYFSAVLNEKLEQSLRTGQPLALLMIDLDLLREINNTHGHLAGDAILERIADVFRSSLREDDIAARFGGEEFVLLLPDTDIDAALALAERVRETIGRQRVPVGEGGETLSATVSIGVAMCPRDGTETTTLIHCADLAVYRAKIQGRNRVVDGRVEPIGHLLPNSEWWGPKPKPEPEPEPILQEAAPVADGDERRSVADPMQVGELAAVGRTAGRDIAIRASLVGVLLTAIGVGVTYLNRPTDIVALLSLVATRRRWPGARAPGRGRRRLGRSCRSAGRRRADRRWRRGRAGARGGRHRRDRSATAGLHLDLQPRCPDHRRPRRRGRLRPGAGQRRRCWNPSPSASRRELSTSPSTRPSSPSRSASRRESRRRSPGGTTSRGCCRTTSRTGSSEPWSRSPTSRCTSTRSRCSSFRSS